MSVNESVSKLLQLLLLLQLQRLSKERPRRKLLLQLLQVGHAS